MTSLNKIEIKINKLLEDIKILKEENTMLKMSLKSSIKAKEEMINNNKELYAKISLALKNSSQED